MKSLIKSLLRKIFVTVYKPFHILNPCERHYSNILINRRLGGGDRSIAYPCLVCGIENIQMGDNVSIGPGATIYTTGAKLIFCPHVVIGPNLTIITGDHMRKMGRFVDTVRGSEKTPEYDQDVTIESDVWIGCNVTILKGVTIGHGSTVAAGAVVTKSCPPYSLIGGVPAKVIKTIYTPEEIVEHERILYGGKYHI